jgi:TonB family protein
MSKVAVVVLVAMTLGFAPPVRAGEEPAVQGAGPELPFLREVHAKAHRLWADNFLVMAATRLPKDNPINLDTRAVELALVLSSEGRLLDVRVDKPSGDKDFDSSALDVIKAAAPFSAAPEAALSDDGHVHLRWTFARNDRRCSGIRLVHEERPLATAIPVLVAQGREGVAIDRIQAVPDQDRSTSFAVFARAWLDRNEDDKALALHVAVANALAGDARGAERLRNAMEKGQAIDEVARGLAALKIPLCPFVKDKLDGATPELRAAVLTVLRHGLDGPCVAWAANLATDRQAGVSERRLAAQALAGHEEPEAVAALKDLLKDKNPALRATAILATTHPYEGRRALFRLTPLLRDKSLDVRAAAATAIVRAGGEDGLTQLFLLFKEKDPSVYESVASELASLSGEESASMLGRFLRKDDPRIRLAAARALARRHDPAAAKLQTTLSAESDAELRFLAGDTQAAAARQIATAAPEGYVWLDSYEALASGSGKLAAVDWALAQFPKLTPPVRIEVMGMWLTANPPKP